METLEPIITGTGVMFMPKPKTSIRPIKVMEWIDKVGPLLEEHYQELALDKRLMVLKPNTEVYEGLERANRVIALGAFVGDEMVGYSVNVLVQHLHYADLWVLQNDIVFITKAHRHGRLGIALIQRTEIAAKERGAKLMLWHAKQRTALEQLLPRMGYGIFETILSKRL
jgi:GNAT superfamily N-acetyltransferase